MIHVWTGSETISFEAQAGPCSQQLKGILHMLDPKRRTLQELDSRDFG